MSKSLYETDFYTWAKQQAEAIRSGQIHLPDTENVAEEIETLGRSEAAALKSAYQLITIHCLKMIHQPEKATGRWENTVNRERLNAADILADNPGLKSKRAALFAGAYDLARKEAAFETRIVIGRFPQNTPFTLEEIESADVWPPGFPKQVSGWMSP